MNPLAPSLLTRLPGSAPGIVAQLLDLPLAVATAELSEALTKLPVVDLSNKDSEAIDGFTARFLNELTKELSSSLEYTADEATNLPGFSFSHDQSDRWDELSASALIEAAKRI